MLVTFDLPTRIIFGVGSITQVGAEAKNHGKKAMVVTYPDIRRVGLLERILTDLKTNGVEAVTFEEVPPNPRSATIDRASTFAREQKVDMVIGLGGGSAMDTAKGVAVGSRSTEPIWDYVIGKVKPHLPILPIIQVPTLAGTGSEINRTAVITNWDTHIKSGLSMPILQARVALIDPQITLTVPLNQTKAGAVDILCHVLEFYITDATPAPLSDGIRETVMKMVVDYLPRAIARLDDIDARTQLSWASTMAMSQFVRVGGGGGTLKLHGIEHALSGYYDVTHGEGLAALLPAWMRFSRTDKKARFTTLGKNVFGQSDGLGATEAWLERVGMKLRLRDLGCELERADDIAALAIKSSPNLKDPPTPIDVKGAARLYRESF